MGNTSGSKQREGSSGELLQFSSNLLEKIDAAVELLLAGSRARCVLVIDRTGLIVSSGGDASHVGSDTMGAVGAGVVAALRTLVADQETPEISIQLYGSEIGRIHFMVLANRLILCMMHSRDNSTGEVRAAARQFANNILPLLREESEKMYDTDELVRSVQYIESKLNEMFRDLT